MMREVSMVDVEQVSGGGIFGVVGAALGGAAAVAGGLANCRPGIDARQQFHVAVHSGVEMTKVLIALSAVCFAALLLYMTTGVFGEVFMYLQALPATTLRLLFSGSIVLLSLIVLSFAVSRKRRAGRLPGNEQ